PKHEDFSLVMSRIEAASARRRTSRAARTGARAAAERRGGARLRGGRRIAPLGIALVELAVAGCAGARRAADADRRAGDDLLLHDIAVADADRAVEGVDDERRRAGDDLLLLLGRDGNAASRQRIAADEAAKEAGIAADRGDRLLMPWGAVNR